MSKPLTLDQFRAAHAAGGVATVSLSAEGGAFYIRAVTTSGVEALLVTTRQKDPRAFGDPAKAIALLHSLGVHDARLDTSAWRPEASAKAKPRPDRALAMRRTLEAVEHDAWFRAEVEQGLAEAARPDVSLLEHEDVVARWRIQRAELLAVAEGESPR
jgi:predicted transcriptional regulator